MNPPWLWNPWAESSEVRSRGCQWPNKMSLGPRKSLKLKAKSLIRTRGDASYISMLCNCKHFSCSLLKGIPNYRALDPSLSWYSGRNELWMWVGRGMGVLMRENLGGFIDYTLTCIYLLHLPPLSHFSTPSIHIMFNALFEWLANISCVAADIRLMLVCM